MAVIGKALPPSDGIVDKVASAVGCEPAVIDAIIRVETASHPYDTAGRLVIRPEYGKIAVCPLLDKAAKAKALKLGKPKLLAYERDSSSAGDAAWGWLDQFAAQFGQEAAFWITSFGAPQIMGFNYTMCKFSSAQSMVQAFADETDAQFLALGEFLLASGLKDACRQRKWKTIARLYNGPAYQQNDYDTKLSNAYAESHFEKSSIAPWPEDDVLEMGEKGDAVRALQQKLSGLGYRLHEDGDFGQETRDAVRNIQLRLGLSPDGKVGPLTQKAIATAAPKDPPATPLLQVIAESSTAKSAIANISVGAVATTVAASSAVTTPVSDVSVDAVLKTAEQTTTLAQKILSIGVDKLLVALGMATLIFGAITLYRRVDAHYSRKIG